jgi:hypothetical protein
LEYRATEAEPIVRNCPKELQHARPLPDGQPDARPMLDCRLKHGLSPKKTVASIKHALDLATVLSPLLDLEVVAVVRKQRLVGSS